MAKLVPLVVYTEGMRQVIGEAIIEDDGTMSGVIHDSEMSRNLSRALESGVADGLSLVPHFNKAKLDILSIRTKQKFDSVYKYPIDTPPWDND